MRNATLYKLATDTGRLIWRYDLDGPPAAHASPTTPLVSHGVVYLGFKQDLYAVKASNGSPLWKEQFSGHSSPIPWVAANDRLYVTSGIRIYALESTKGTIQWYHDVQWAQGNVLAMRGDTSGVYAMLFNAQGSVERQIQSLFALDASTGRERWRIPMTIPEMFFSSHVNPTYLSLNKQLSSDNGIIYFTTLIRTSNGVGTYLSAVSTRNGGTVWRSAPMEDALQIVLQPDVIYLSGVSDIYALNAKSGVLLWHHKGDIAIDETVFVTQDKLSFLETNLQGDYLTTVNATNGNVESHQRLNDSYHLDIDRSLPPDNGGPYYVQSPRETVIEAHTTYAAVFKTGSLEALNTQSGALLWSYTFPDTNGIGAARLTLVEAP